MNGREGSARGLPWPWKPRCQFEESPHSYTRPFGALRSAKRALHRLSTGRGPAVSPGKPSRFEPGQRVRIRSSDEIAATLDAAGTLQGMPFLATQWTHHGTFEVERQVRRFLDGDARIHRMSTAVALRGVSCDGADGTPGCGRACSMFYRDEWLEPSEDPLAPPPERLMVRVKSEREIRATLDRQGTLDGMSFRPEMARFAGQRLPLLRRLEFDPGPLPWWKHARGEWYALAGARCEGEPFAATGGCDRGCAFAWHRSWLDMEGDPGHDGPEGRKPD